MKKKLTSNRRRSNKALTALWYVAASQEQEYRELLLPKLGDPTEQEIEEWETHEVQLTQEQLEAVKSLDYSEVVGSTGNEGKVIEELYSPRERLFRLNKAARMIRSCVLETDVRESLQGFATIVGRTIDAEVMCCLIRNEPGQDESEILVSTRGFKKLYQADRLKKLLTFEAHSDGATSVFINQINDGHIRLPSNVISEGVSLHLPDGCYDATLMPIHGRSERVRGVVLLLSHMASQLKENRPLNTDDIECARILIEEMETGLEYRDRIAVSSRLTALLSPLVDLQSALVSGLEIAVEYLDGVRGQIALWDKRSSSIYIAAEYHSDTCDEKHGSSNDRLEKMGTVWSGSLDERDAVFDSGQSVIVRIGGDRPLGVICVESFNPGWFGSSSVETLRFISQFFAHYVERVRDANALTEFSGISENANEHDRTQLWAKYSIEMACRVLGIENAITFVETEVIDNEHPGWRRLASYGTLARRSDEQGHVVGKHSLILWVKDHGEPVYVEDPTQDDRVDVECRRRLGIEGPALVVPLKCNGRTFGAVLFWGRGDKGPAGCHLSFLKHFTNLMARGMKQGWSQTGDRPQFRCLFLQEPDEESPIHDEHAKWINDVVELFHGLNMMDRIGFVSLSSENRSLKILKTLPTERPLERKGMESLRVEEIPYLATLAKPGFSESGATIYYPNHPTLRGQNALTEDIQKPTGLPWVVVPVKVDGEVIGFIEADNGISHRPISKPCMEILQFVGDLIASGFDIINYRYSVLSELSPNFPKLHLEDPDECAFLLNTHLEFQCGNDAFLKEVGATRLGLIGKTDFHFYPPADARKYRADDIGVLKGTAIKGEIEKHRFGFRSRSAVVFDKEAICDPVTGKAMWLLCRYRKYETETPAISTAGKDAEPTTPDWVYSSHSAKLSAWLNNRENSEPGS